MYAAILANVARHVTLTPAEADVFTALLVPQHVVRAGTVLAAGQATRQLTFVARGCVRTYSTDAQGKEHTLTFATEGWWCGNFSSLYSPTATTLAIQALEDTDVLHLSLDHLELLCEQVPKFERFFRLLFQNALLIAQRRHEARAKLPAAERYARFCRHYPQLPQRVAQKFIASYLGITPEFLSALRKKNG